MIEVDTALATVLRADVASLVAGTLGALGCTGAWHMEAPEGSTYPFVLFQQTSDVKLATNGKAKAFSNLLYMVKSVDLGDDHSRAANIAARVEALLNDQTLTLTGGLTNASLRLEGALDLPDHIDGQTYQQVGGIYRIWVT